MKESTVPVKKEETAVAETREQSRVLVPAADIFEVDDGLAVVVDLPGVDKSDLDVRVDDNTLTISGKAKTETPGQILHREYELLNYFRQFVLNDEVDQEKIKADMKNGVLTVYLPNAEKAKPKQITVKVG